MAQVVVKKLSVRTVYKLFSVGLTLVLKKLKLKLKLKLKISM